MKQLDYSNYEQLLIVHFTKRRWGYSDFRTEFIGLVLVAA